MPQQYLAPRVPPVAANKVEHNAALPVSKPMPDPYYGHEETSKVCAKLLVHLFGCPQHLPPSKPPLPLQLSSLAHFIAYACYRTELPKSVTFAAAHLLHRLKVRYHHARGGSGQRLFLTAYMLAAKTMMDECYSNKCWVIVGQGMFKLRELNHMEREMCRFLDWNLNIHPNALKIFEIETREDFGTRGPGPIYASTSSMATITVPTSSYTSLGTMTSYDQPTAESTSLSVPPLVSASQALLANSTFSDLPDNTRYPVSFSSVTPSRPTYPLQQGYMQPRVGGLSSGSAVPCNCRYCTNTRWWPP
ncbi:hypothetical protein AcW2_007011 [Taiwanofungus camphoratus]|nr:hypothetical protein AcW2_007011 [Antrodia cinnamomea]